MDTVLLKKFHSPDQPPPAAGLDAMVFNPRRLDAAR
jgi:hypothetical protein